MQLCDLLEWRSWNGPSGQVDTEAKIHDGNKDTLNTYWTQFEEYIHPQTVVQTATGAMEQVPNLVEKARNFHSCQTLATDVGKADTKKCRTAKLWMQHAEVVERNVTLRSLSQGETLHTLSRSSTGFHQHCRGRDQWRTPLL